MQLLDRPDDLAPPARALVLDQYGVLHDGTAPYPGVVAALERLRAAGIRLALLSNSGKRAAANAARLTRLGIDPGHFEVLMTSGEALWQDVAAGALPHRRLWPVTARPGDAEAWAAGLDIALVPAPAEADAVLLMGLADGADTDGLLDDARARGLPLICSNPDLAAPRAGGRRVAAPGALAERYRDSGGAVTLYGKPHPPIFRTLARRMDLALPRMAMVGDSLDHDIAGAARVGMRTIFVRGGLHRGALEANPAARIAALCRERHVPLPDATLRELA